MALHIIRYAYQQQTRWGILEGDRITPIPSEAGSTREFLAAHSLADLEWIRKARGYALDRSVVTLLAPVTPNQQFLCLGANYRQHMLESGIDPDQKRFNMMFTKASSCIVAADSPVVKPKTVKFLDYEVELGVVLRRDVKRASSIDEGNLHEFVAGLVIVNDYSARDVQIPQMQFYKGKSFRTFGPVGPLLCLLDPREIRYLRDMELRLHVNGELRQSDNSANLVWGVAESLRELSEVHDLFAGDLLATGTPSGCALSVPSPGRQRLAALLPEQAKWKMFEKIQSRRTQYLRPGDVVEASIRSRDGLIDLGTQRNVVVEEA